MKNNMKLIALKRSFTALIIAGFASSFWVQSAAAIEIQEVTSEKGIKAYLVEDHTVPLVAMSFQFKGGATQDEKGKAGTAQLMSTTLDEGAGDIKSQEFLAKLDELGIELRYNAGVDNFSGSFKTLTEYQDEAFNLLKLSVNEPRFDQEPVERLKSQLLVGLKNKTKRASEISRKLWREKLIGDHPYAVPVDGSVESMSSLTGEDLHKLHKRIFAKDNLYIGVVGAINADQLKKRLDAVFGNLPAKADLKTISEKQIEHKGILSAEVDVPQASISMWLPGIKRNAPDFFTAYIVNHILGGGTFSSRLYSEVREKRGLTYGVNSFLATYDHLGLIGFNLGTSPENAQKAIEIIKQEIKKMAEQGPTQEELEATQKFLAGTYAINNLDTSAKIASVLVGLQAEGLGIDYIENRQNLIKAVTLEKAKAKAAELLSGEPTIIIVGPKSALQ